MRNRVSFSVKIVERFLKGKEYQDFLTKYATAKQKETGRGIDLEFCRRVFNLARRGVSFKEIAKQERCSQGRVWRGVAEMMVTE